jgi:hypothetical protein
MDNQHSVLVTLRQLMSNRMSLSEIQTLCFDLDVDYDNIAGNTKDDKIRELLLFLQRRENVSRLIKIGKILRPDIIWDREIILLQLGSADSELSTASIKSICTMIDDGKLPLGFLINAKDHRYWLIRKIAIEYIVKHEISNSIDLIYEFRNTSYHVSQQLIRDYVENLLDTGKLTGDRRDKAISIIEHLAKAPKATQGSKSKNEQLLQKICQEGSYVLSPAEIAQQQTLLATHRRTLASYLQRLGILTTAHAPPEITHGIAEARANIARVKAILRTSGVNDKDHPDDIADE